MTTKNSLQLIRKIVNIETLLDIATDKVDSEVPSTAAGVIKEILFDTNSVVSIPIGSVIKIAQQGIGAVTIAGMSGIIIMSSASFITIGQYRVATLTKTAIDTWYIEYSV